MSVPNAMDKVVFRGKIMDRKTAALLAIAERRLGYELTVVQGCFSNAVSQSGGTHNGSGAGDLAPFDHRKKVRVLRGLGCAAWYRPAIPKLWGAHIHFIVIGSEQLSPEAQSQVVQYKAGTDGLAGHRPDLNKYHPDVEPFSYSAAYHDDMLRQRITGLKARAKTLADKLSNVRERMRESSQKITYRQ
jgi:hypothetical protein